MYNFFSLSFFLVSILIGTFFIFYSCGFQIFSSTFSVISSWILLDNVSFYLIILVVCLGLYSQLCFSSYLTDSSKIFILLSLSFSICCFCTTHAILFWCFYELSMLPLLFLIFKDSPYSERFIAGWYFAAYLLVTSLPLLLILMYLSFINDCWIFSGWTINNDIWWLYVILAFIFFTKVPLCPFHTWLPIVHAEATSIVSIFLSGYIMKLGLLGVYRCAFFIFNANMLSYLYLCLVASVLFFVVSSSELDGKRWLAFLSLAHIVVPFLGLYICDWDHTSLLFIYCFGHGLSAGLVFGVLWYFYDLCNSRNWLLLKSGISGKITMFLIIISLLSLCSFPPSLQFFCEVQLVSQSSFSLLYWFFWCWYLFIGGLVPLVLCGFILIRSECVESHSFNFYPFYLFLVFMVAWCFCGILIL
uniref:NADH dehydrogenase subunit 4 n=1 Tax=Nippotaenia mogurndae TaxID=116902 RepID=UPI0021CCB255|nr:NADH dehydrogenase subunit 4 [Nippotaenia mogurndae]UWT58589.1 NADH dehydrogenase subunit 4 [Nippotaenia mogurndae]